MLVLPSVGDVIFVVLFLYLSLEGGRGLLADGDTGYHIRAGEVILDTGAVPRHDIFSFLSPPPPWIAHEWLSEVIMALAHRAAGLTGVVVLYAFLIALIFSLLWRFNRTPAYNSLASLALILLAALSSSIHWLARPHIFSLLLLVIWHRLLDVYQYHGKNRLFLLPPLMVLWVNLHGGFVIGFLLLAAYLAGNLWGYFAVTGTTRQESGVRARNLAALAAVCALASLVNPYGFDLLLFPFRLVWDGFLPSKISEYQSPNFHDPMPFRYLLYVAIAIGALARARVDATELFLLIGFLHMALYSVRHVPLFALVAVPVIARKSAAWLHGAEGTLAEFVKRRSENLALGSEASRFHVWPPIAVAGVIPAVALGTIQHGFDPATKPVAAVEFLKQANLPGNMFNNDEFGDYIIYAAWPQYKVFFDSRPDMYGSEHLKEYLRVAWFDTGWEDVLEKYNIDWIIYNSESPLVRYLRAHDGWSRIYADKVATILVRDSPQNRKGTGRVDSPHFTVRGRDRQR